MATELPPIEVQNVDVSINLPSSGLTIIDSIRNWLDELVKDIRTGDDEVILGVASTVIIIVAFTFIWRTI